MRTLIALLLFITPAFAGNSVAITTTGNAQSIQVTQIGTNHSATVNGQGNNYGLQINQTGSNQTVSVEFNCYTITCNYTPSNPLIINQTQQQ